MADLWWPVDNVRITGEFGNSPEFYAQFGQRGHNGIDIGVPLGTPVYAAFDGKVQAEGWGSANSWMGSIAGIYVLIRHAWGYSAYAHLNSTVVDAGQTVKRGQLIGYSGMTGVGTGPHLHFETFPLAPNFGNGYAGRVNPRIHNLQKRGSTTAPPKPTTPTTPSQIGLPETMFILILQRKHNYLVIPQGTGKPRAVLLGKEGNDNGAYSKLPVVPAHSAQFTMTDLGKAIDGLRPDHLKPVK